MPDFPEINEYKTAHAIIGLPGAALRILIYVTESGGLIHITYEKLAEVCSMTVITLKAAMTELHRRNIVTSRIVGRTPSGKYIYRIRRKPGNILTDPWDEEAGRFIDKPAVQEPPQKAGSRTQTQDRA